MSELVDNQDTQTQDNDLTQDVDTQVDTQVDTSGFSWKNKLGNDLGNAPTFKKFDDTEEGLRKAAESYANLEKLLGHEKVPIPKGEDDVEGWARFSKAWGVPDDPLGYELKDPEVTESMKVALPDKEGFLKTAHDLKLNPSQAQKAWDKLVNGNINSYKQAIETHQKKINEVANSLRNEWGDAYQSNVELGQFVINKFAGDKDTEDFLTSAMAKDPRGVKFLAKIGQQFAENQVGDFKYQRFSKTPAEAQAEIEKIRLDPNHPYLNPNATPKDHEAAVEYMNKLYQIVGRQG